MAKRSVRKTRHHEAPGTTQPTSASEASPTRARRHFWLGALAAAVVLIPVAIVAVILSTSSNQSAPKNAAAETNERIESEAERLRRVSQARDKEQVEDLTQLMRRYADDLDPVVDGLDATFPPAEDDKLGALAKSNEVADWVKTAREAASYFEESVSGDTGTNVARGLLASAVRGIARTTETYQLALDQAGARDRLLQQARAQRDDAMHTWETAAVQVDLINVAVGFGHQHPPTPGARSLPPDELPEGTDATDG